MPWKVIVDDAEDIAALIEPIVGRALGPIALGKDGAKILEAFAGVHGADPATIPQPTLESRWQEFLDNLIDGGKGDEAKPAEPAPAEGAPLGAQVPAAPASDAPPPAATPEDPDPAAAGPTPATSPTVGGDAPPPAPSDTDREIPRREFTAGYVVCPTCDGFTTIAENGAEVECPTCKGEGQILAEQPEPGAAEAATA